MADTCLSQDAIQSPQTNLMRTRSPWPKESRTYSATLWLSRAQLILRLSIAELGLRSVVTAVESKATKHGTVDSMVQRKLRRVV